MKPPERSVPESRDHALTESDGARSSLSPSFRPRSLWNESPRITASVKVRRWRRRLHAWDEDNPSKEAATTLASEDSDDDDDASSSGRIRNPFQRGKEKGTGDEGVAEVLQSAASRPATTSGEGGSLTDASAPVSATGAEVTKDKVDHPLDSIGYLRKLTFLFVCGSGDEIGNSIS